MEQELNIHKIILVYISNKMQGCTVYFIWKPLYMFRAVLPIIRNANNYLKHLVICHTVTSTCRFRGKVGTGLSVLWMA
jgi:hypothetical protein